jgi:hypothetical protein
MLEAYDAGNVVFKRYGRGFRQIVARAMFNTSLFALY